MIEEFGPFKTSHNVKFTVTAKVAWIVWAIQIKSMTLESKFWNPLGSSDFGLPNGSDSFVSKEKVEILKDYA